jgi:hypothetical protein
MDTTGKTAQGTDRGVDAILRVFPLYRKAYDVPARSSEENEPETKKGYRADSVTL